MPGPTTEVLNDDIRILRDEVHRVDLDVRELITKVGGIITSIKILGVFTLGGLASGLWWGGSLTTKVDGLSGRIDKVETRIEKLETKIDARFDKVDDRFKEINARFDRLEGLIGKLLEQSKPAVKP
jgi:outer membrane murein-binding lipoprotein Lpp